MRLTAVLAALVLTSAAGAQNITGDGGGTVWTVGTSGARGLRIIDADRALQTDAFDDGAVLFLGSGLTSVVSGAGATFTASTAQSTLQAIAGLNVRTRFWADPNNAVLRSYISFQNAGTGSVTIPVSWQSNVGSDAATAVLGSSSGDTLFTLADRWVVTDNASDADVLAVNHVLWGSGASVTPTSVSQSVFADLGNQTQGVRADFSLTVAPGQTAALMFFHQLNEVGADAVASGTTYNAQANLQAAGLLADLSEAELSAIVNWNLIVPEPSAIVLVLCGAIPAGCWRRRAPRGRRRAG